MRGRTAVAMAALPVGGLFAAALLALASGSGGATTRTYYIAADEVEWDYAPSGRNLISGLPFDEVERDWVATGPDRIGRVYLKALYREYMDSTFTTLKPRPPEWEHLGFLGPLLRAQVGDTIRVVFRNNARFPASVHPHGVFYTKSSEGAPSADGTSGADRADDGVPPGGTHVYVWPVPERAGPAHGDPSSVLWMYHSHVNEEKDVSTGLLGAMIVTARGKARADASPEDVDREIVVAFAEVDENESWFLDHNIDTYTTDPASVPRDQIAFFQPFGDSNFKESMNGFLYGHLRLPDLRVGDKVRWYLMADTNFSVHAPHWHGNTVVANHMRTDVVSLTTMEMLIADMVPDDPGAWLFHCHVGGHLKRGMQARYTVLPEDLARR
ncbi:MAG TPA: multicopper oxidase domain-containing protein [Gemmatimonadota bacterium]|nr:multicopper oxidase domain-containing protein [Gemmatimonadota bacterium]